ncbi:MAG: hypothetical protein LBG92_10910 [Prevotellaceae bacterium]|nr:hypothetical protein [Prevotellaceae bacterium]
MKLDLEDWADSIQYGANEIAEIPPSNPNSTNEPTSIPSPFARLALTKTAFTEVAEKGANALKAYQQIVSNSLDVAEIFFKFSTLKDHAGLEIIEWSYNDLQNIQSGILKSTLELFFQGDAQSLNLINTTTFYFLRHKNTGKIIGGTSPRTMFFSAANVKRRKGGIVEPEFIKADGTFFIKSDQTNTYAEFGKIELGSVIRHYAFSGITPLSHRDMEFREYLHRWVIVNNNIEIPEFSAYELSQIAANEIQHFNDLPNNLDDYKKLQFIDNKNIIYPKILAKDLYEAGGRVSSDYFEEKIIQLPKPIENGYFSGNHTNTSDKCVLLPLKDKFFEDYTVEQLETMISIDGSASIQVTLNCSVKGQIATYTKVYTASDIITLSGETDFMLFPNVKFNDAGSAFYRFGLFRAFRENKTMSAKFYNQSNEVALNETNEVITRNENDKKNNICTTYALENKEFDHVKILIDGNISGVIIPKLEKKDNNIEFTFAVDFGTTNTHIEYKTDVDGNIKSFDITDQDEQISWFVNPGEKVCYTRLVADIDFIPEHIGFENAENLKVKFPTRTALIVTNNATTDIKLPFAHTNIVLPFDKRDVPAYDGTPITQLKWESKINEVGYYIENLCYLMRNKVVLGNGRLAETKIHWTYPLSMNSDRLGKVTKKWEEAYKKYFDNNPDDNCTNLTESLAPFYYYRQLENYDTYIKDLVSIDIGGGTTDVLFVKDGNPNFVTSFRFAANDLLGLGQHVSKIIVKHKQDIKNKISKSYNLVQVMKSIEQNVEFGDFASFFFSLKDNEELKEMGISIDFNDMLEEDNNQKLVFLLFFAAIVYHTAQVMKAKGLSSMPRHLTFSGNGSRIIYVVGKKNMLEKIASLVFEKIFDAKYGNGVQPTKLEIIPNTSNPKEVTSKGTIQCPDPNIRVNSCILFGYDDTSVYSSETESATKPKYSDVNSDDFIDKINLQVSTFFNFVVNELLKSEIKKQVGSEAIENALLIPQAAIDKAKEVVARKADMKNITKNKISTKEQSANIEETFFFFPIPTLLRTISNEIEYREN